MRVNCFERFSCKVLKSLCRIFKSGIHSQKSNFIIECLKKFCRFVVDMLCTTMINVTKEFKFPSLVLFTSAIAFIGLMLYFHTLKEEGNTEWVMPSYAKPLPTQNFPTISLRNQWGKFSLAYERGLKIVDGFIINLYVHRILKLFYLPDFKT